ncbi:hypothetical protein [Candidatus Allofournierella merdipullorum]|uniref:hypothetical protein n=1 Tax=Candidatus Allofournierella merdipullorum TaxID=2838595 RepID=UPI00374F9D6B
MNTNKEKTLIALEKAERLYREVNSTENNCVYFDADSILYEYLTDVPMGLFEELCKGYRNCEDTDTFEALFYMLTGITFQEFLDRCVKETCVVASESAQSNPEPEIKLALMPNDEVWVLFRPNLKTETEQVEANTPPQICRSVVKEVIVSLDSKGTPASRRIFRYTRTARIRMRWKTNCSSMPKKYRQKNAIRHAKLPSRH